MKKNLNNKMLALAVVSSMMATNAFAADKNNKPNYGGSASSYKYNDYTYNNKSSSSSSSSSKSSSSPNYGSSSSYSSPKKDYSYSTPSKPSYVPSAPKKDYSYSTPSAPSKPSYTTPKQDYSYTAPKKDYSYTTPSKPSYSTPTPKQEPAKPNYGGSSSSYKYNDYTYTKPSTPAKPVTPKQDYGSNSGYTAPKKDYSYNPTPSKPPTYTTPKQEPAKPNYGGSSSAYKYNDYTYSKPKYDIAKPIQNNNNNYNNNNSYGRPPQTNKNGTVLLKELKPGQSRVRADGTSDKVHKDGKGYTHTFVDGNGNVRKESIRYDKNGREVKISDTERRTNGDVITKYKSGVSEIRTKDGLRYQQDRYGKTVYQEKYSTWNNRPVIQRHYHNNYTTVYVQNNYYGYPAYFYRPTYFDYNYYNYSLSVWSRPVVYSWHWSYNPWYYNYYRPYPTYYSPAYWLTDYLLMSLIQSNYERIAADNEVIAVQSQYSQVALNEQIKEEIRVQVEQALRQQQAAVQNNSTMDPSQILTQGRLMVVHADLTVEDENGSQCQLDEGDVIRLINQPTAQNPIAELKVVSAKGTSCPAGTTLSLSANNLIDMENEFQSRIQQGMNEMKTNKVGNN
jgi:hypothetical protein